MKPDWQTKRLGEIFDIKSSKRVHKSDWRKEGVPFYRAREVVKLAKYGYVNNELFISEKLYREFTRLTGCPSKGDIIVSAVGTLGQCYVVKETDRFYFKDASVLWFSKKIDVISRYIEYLFLSNLVLKQVMHKSMGATVGTLTITRAKNIRIPFPPIPEQKRIVKILDEAFRNLEIAKNNSEKNLKNAKELFESYLQSIFEKGGDDWISDLLINLTTKIGSGATPRGGKDAYHKEGISLIRSLNVYDYGFKKKKLAFIDNQQADKLSNVTIKRNDVLLNITGASVARCCIVPNEILPARVNQHVSIIRLIQEKLLPDFIHYLLISKPYKSSLLGIGHKGGATRQAITKTKIQKFEVSFPKSLEKQKEIVNKLNKLNQETTKLEGFYKQKISDLEELKKSLLHKAFVGEL